MTTAEIIDIDDDASSERALRVRLAAAYRLVDYFGWTELIYGHLTARVPGPELHFLINPYGLNYDEVTASNLVKIDCDGNIIGDSDYPVNAAGFVIHSAIHMAGTDNKCVMHTHSRAGMAIAALKDGLRPVSMNAITFHGQVGYHDFEGPSLHLDERERLLADLGDNKAMILRNHGLLTVGETVAQAFSRLYRLERASQVQIAAAAAGPLNMVSAEVSRKACDDARRFVEQEGLAPGALEFAALTRKIDKIDDSYRQ